jgi:hypothetical protein
MCGFAYSCASEENPAPNKNSNGLTQHDSKASFVRNPCLKRDSDRHNHISFLINSYKHDATQDLFSWPPDIHGQTAYLALSGYLQPIHSTR